MAARMILGDSSAEHACSLVATNSEPCTNLRCFRRSISALCDFYGFIWFLVGIDQLYTESGDAHEVPATVTVTVLLLTASMLYYLIPFLIQYSLMRSPPVDPNDRLYLYRLQHEAQAPLLDRDDREVRNRWRRWLQIRGCEEHPFGWDDICHRVSFDGQADVENNASSEIPATDVRDRLLRTNSRNSTEWSCSICLQSFRVAKKEEDNGKRAESQDSSDPNYDVEHGIVVAFPCRPRHIFHASCLHRWLQVCGERAENDGGITCPCCRQQAMASG
eukprot:gene30942-37398_t